MGEIGMTQISGRKVDKGLYRNEKDHVNSMKLN